MIVVGSMHIAAKKEFLRATRMAQLVECVNSWSRDCEFDPILGVEIALKK